MSKIDDGGPAFPVPTISGPDLSVDYPPYVRGMTLRDWFAGNCTDEYVEKVAPTMIHECAAMIGIDASKYSGSKHWPMIESRIRYAYADAMLAARKETP